MGVKFVPHTTRDELDFIGSLGSCKNVKRRTRALEGYIAAAKKRTDWDGIDKNQVIAYALRLSVV